jgi:nucleoid-associated protein YgaU
VPAKPIEPGKYRLRLDRLAKDGKPVPRLELPFVRVPVPPVTGNGERLVVVRGDSLWNTTRARYGNGFRHTLIYGASKDQIRDPDLMSLAKSSACPR